jgi:Ser/Thr protein kinase RdoA (MazF antagonist)
MNTNLIRRSADLYGLSPTQIHPVQGGQSCQVYTCSRDVQEFILRISPPNEDINLDNMQSMLDWMRFLSTRVTSVTRPVPSQRGCLVEQIEQDGQSYILTAFEKARGILAEELYVDQWNEVLSKNLGRTVGRVHAISREYLPPKGLMRRPVWDQINNCYHCNAILDQSCSLIQSKREQIRQAVQALPRDPGSYGLIHGDLHCANFFVDITDNTITLFDFDDCCYGWYAMDIAMSVFDLLVLYPLKDQTAFASSFLERYLEGYLHENSLAGVWIERLPLFLKLLEVEIYADLAKDYAAGKTGSWSSLFMPGRDRRIEKDVPYVNIDFLEIYRRVVA